MAGESDVGVVLMMSEKCLNKGQSLDQFWIRFRSSNMGYGG